MNRYKTKTLTLKVFFRLILFLVLFAPATAFSLPDSFTGTVVEVLEGDTIKVLYKGKLVNVRLSFIDCPEHGQAYGKEAIEFTEMMALAGPARVVVKSVNSMGVLNAEVTMTDANLNINRELVKAGFAWSHGKHSSDTRYEALEKVAREMRLGLWKRENPSPPWKFKDKAHGQ